MDHESNIVVGDKTFVRSWARAQLCRTPEANPAFAAAKAASDNLHWQSQDNPDLTFVHFILDTEGANGNWDYMPRAQLVQSYATAVYKPIDVDHVVKEKHTLVGADRNAPPAANTICGVMTHAALAWAVSGQPLTSKELKDLDLTDDMNRPDDEKIAVVAFGALYGFLFPKTVASLTKSIDDGKMHVSMERWIGKMDFLVHDGKSGYQAIARDKADAAKIDQKWAKHIPINDQPVYRRSLSYVYGGAASTINPANPMSRFLTPQFVKAAASVGPEDPSLNFLLTQHGELHTRFAISTRDEQAGLIAAHERVTRAIAAYTNQG